MSESTPMSPKKIVIIGAQVAGLAAAKAARRANSSTEITVVDSGEYAGTAACGLPHFINGSIKDPTSVAPEDTGSILQKLGIKLLLGHTAVKADPIKRWLRVKNRSGVSEISWDSLIVTTGSKPNIPANFKRALKCNNFFVLKNMIHALLLKQRVETAKEVIIIGAGYIGLNLAEIFLNKGATVKIIDAYSGLGGYPINSDFADILTEQITSAGADLILNEKSARPIIRKATITGVETSIGLLPCDTLICCAGVKPDTDFADILGLDKDEAGSIKIDDQCETSIAGVYSAGDCASAKSIITKRPVQFKLAVNAFRTGNIAGTNAALSSLDKPLEYPGTPMVTNAFYFGFEVATTGLYNLEQLFKHFKGQDSFVSDDYDEIIVSVPLKPFDLDKSMIRTGLVYHKKTARVHGGSFIAPFSACLRADLLASFLSAKVEHQGGHIRSINGPGLTLYDLLDIETGYNPAIRTFNDPLCSAARAALKKIKRNRPE